MMEEILANIIGAVESGGMIYGKRDYGCYVPPYHLSPIEHTITIGWPQFYGPQGKELLRRIYEKGIDYIGSFLDFDWVKTKWNPKESEKQLIIKAITSDIGKKIQDEMFYEIMSDYILDCEELYTKNRKATVMYCEIRHLGGESAVNRIFKQLNGDYSLENILTILMKDQKDANKNLVGSEKFWSRHLKCVEFANKYVEDYKMTEKDVTLCGHGSGKPSTKVMYSYNESRYNSFASNGKRRGVVAVRRLKGLTDAQRKQFHDNYYKIIGRNFYDQNLREYCYIPYANGNFYSDCSSSGIKTFELIGFKFPWTLNTAGIYESNLFENVNVTIVNGHIANPELLKVGDAILYVGNDPNRPLQIGHVEFVYAVSNPDKTYPYWIQDGDTWYYRVEEGKNAHGWMKISETKAPCNVHWYYFNEKGEMLKGWQFIDGEWFYLQQNGELEGALWHGKENGALEVWYV